MTVIDRSNRSQTELVEESQPVPVECYDRLFEAMKTRLGHAAALVLSGTATPGAPADFYARCTEAARSAGLLTLVDAKGDLLLNTLAQKPDLVKPNREELSVTASKALETEAETIGAMRSLVERGARNVVVTAGKEPTVAVDAKGSVWRISSVAIEALNPIGSGDAFTAALAWRLTQGDSLAEACRWGAAAGAANALELMAGEVQLNRVKDLHARITVEQVSI